MPEGPIEPATKRGRPSAAVDAVGDAARDLGARRG